MWRAATHASSVRNARVVPKARPDVGEPQQRKTQGSGNPQSKENTNTWKEILQNLLSIKESLLKGADSNRGHAAAISEVIARVEQAAAGAGTTASLDERLERIENLLQKSTKQQEAPKNATWADIVASNTRHIQANHAYGSHVTINNKRHTVRIQLAQAKGLESEQLLQEVKKTIPGAAAVRILRSGDIDVTVPDEATKDKVYTLPATEGLKIYRKDYTIEVPGVPVSLVVAEGSQADNTALAARIIDASKSIAPGLQITRIRWLHNTKESTKRTRAERNQRPRTAGSLIIGLATQEMQRRAVKGGIVINATLYEPRLFERSLQIAQCFNCQEWGHTQNACGKHVTCGRCAGDHQSESCKKEGVSCANCGKKHRAWQRQQCPTFQAYSQGINRKRAILYAQTINIREARDQQASPPEEGWSMITRKRARQNSQEAAKRGPGRPTYISQAARQADQMRIDFGAIPVTFSQATSTQESDE
jgi:hypothetical protein